MNNPIVTIFRNATALAFTGLLWTSTQAQESFEMSDLVVTTALTDMTGEDFVMESTKLGDGTITAAGGDFSMEAAVISLATIVLPGEIALSLATDGNNLVLSWPETGGTYILEWTPALSPGTIWQPVQPAPTEQNYITPLTQSALFFRLRRE